MEASVTNDSTFDFHFSADRGVPVLLKAGRTAFLRRGTFKTIRFERGVAEAGERPLCVGASSLFHHRNWILIWDESARLALPRDRDEEDLLSLRVISERREQVLMARQASSRAQDPEVGEPRGTASGKRSYAHLEQDHEVDVPREKIQRTMTTMLSLFSVHPLDAYHPRRQIELQEAVPVLSALNRSHGLTDHQVEGLRNLLSNWNRVINDAVEAGAAKKKASQHLSSIVDTAMSLKTAESKNQMLQEDLEEVKDAWRISRANKRREYEAQIRKKMAGTVLEINKLKQSLREAEPMAPTLKQQIESAEQSMEKANREWKAMKMLLREINSSLFLK